MGASSRSPSPITMVPRMGMEPMVFPLAHRVSGGDGGSLHHPQKSRGQITLYVPAKGPGFSLRFGIGCHNCLRMNRFVTITPTDARAIVGGGCLCGHPLARREPHDTCTGRQAETRFRSGARVRRKESRVFLWVNRAEGAFAPPHKLLAGHAVTIPKGRLKPGKLIRAAP